MSIDLSIVVPIYNVETYLKKCIESILSQTFKDFELILINDGSTDGSGKICDDYEKKDHRIKVIHKENGGVSSARNIGIDLANGKYIGFVDPDDDIDSNMYKDMLDYTFNKEVDIVVCAINTINEITNTVSKSRVWDEVNCIINKKDIEEKLIPGILKDSPYSTNSSCNKIYKKDIFNKFDVKFNEKKHHGEDARLNLILLTKINNIVFTDKALYNYHIRQRESLTQKLRLDLYDYILDNTKFGINLCRKYNLEDQIDNYINVYISNTINYMQSVVKSSIPMKDKYKIISHIMFESTFIENIESYNCPSIYYRVLKRVCMKKNIFIFVLMVKLKNIIRK